MTVKYAKLSNKQIKQILKYFCLELTAVQAAKMLGLNRNTIDRYYQIFREKIIKYQDDNLQKLSGEVEKSKSNLYTDQWRSYDGLVLSGYRHRRINHSKEFARNHNHINGIESFWSYVKRKMRKHNGIRRNKFYLYLKEAEFRFNHRNHDIYNLLLKIIFA